MARWMLGLPSEFDELGTSISDTQHFLPCFVVRKSSTPAFVYFLTPLLNFQFRIYRQYDYRSIYKGIRHWYGLAGQEEANPCVWLAVAQSIYRQETKFAFQSLAPISGMFTDISTSIETYAKSISLSLELGWFLFTSIILSILSI